MALTSGTKLGPYEIVAPLGAGGMGEVYRARDARLTRDVAIKVLPASYSEDRDRLRRFEQEARAAAGLNHPNLLAVHDIGTQNGSPYIVSELLEGETLRTRIHTGPLPVRKATEYAEQVARGLAAAHEKGIVHRDLKPENIFLTRDGRVKILDFGLAKLIEPDLDQSGTSAPTVDTTPGVVLGTVGYMSPEQVRGAAADHRSDIFSFGAILYEMLSGKRAFKGDTSADTMSSILKDDPPELTETNRSVPPALERIVRHCLEKNPEERFQSARDVAFDLGSLTTESSTLISSPAKGRVAPRSHLMLLGIVAAIAAVAGWLLHSSFSRTPAANFERLTFRRGMITGARFTPDGRTAVYAAQWGDNPVQLFAVNLAEPSQTRELQLPSACLLAISPNGDLAVALEPTIQGHLFCRGTLARAPLAGGAPRELLDNVEFADWNRAGTDLAIVHIVAGGRRLEYPIGKVLYSTPGWISDPRIAPAGDAIAFLEHPLWPDDRGRVAIVDASGHHKVLAGEFSAEDGLVWSPNGNEIWFTATPSGGKRSLYAVTRAGKMRLVNASPGALHLFDISRDEHVLAAREDMWDGIRALGPDSDKLRDLSWLDWSLVEDISPDGKWILMGEEGDGAGPAYRTYLRKTDGSVPIELGQGQPSALSHDGKWALSIGMTSPPSLTLLPTRAGSPRRLESYGIEYYRSADFLPDDKGVLFCGNEPNHGSRFYTQPANGGPPKPVTPEGFNPFFPSAKVISPDGEFFLALAPDSKPVLVPIDGGQPRPAAGILPGEVPWRWANTQSVFVAKRREIPMRIYRVDVFTAKRQLWKEVNVDDPSGLIFIGILQITPDGKYYAFTHARAFSELYSIDGLR